MNELTATLAFTSSQSRILLPSQMLFLCENFRPVYTGIELPLTGSGSVEPSQVTAGSPGHQLAHGMLAYAWMFMPVLLASNSNLAQLVGEGPRGVTTKPLRSGDAHRAYEALGGKVRVDMTLYEGTCISMRDVEHAQRCGLDVRCVDARERRGVMA